MAFLRLLGRYGLAGLANTALGLGLILLCDIGLHLRPAIANAVGYVAGWVLSYGLNRWFVFRSRESHRVTGVRYVLAVGVAFAMNQAVLFTALRWLPQDQIGHSAAQFAGVVTYTALLFGLCTVWVFPQAKSSA